MTRGRHRQAQGPSDVGTNDRNDRPPLNLRLILETHLPSMTFVPGIGRSGGFCRHAHRVHWHTSNEHAGEIGSMLLQVFAKRRAIPEIVHSMVGFLRSDKAAAPTSTPRFSFFTIKISYVLVIGAAMFYVSRIVVEPRTGF